MKRTGAFRGALIVPTAWLLASVMAGCGSTFGTGETPGQPDTNFADALDDSPADIAVSDENILNDGYYSDAAMETASDTGDEGVGDIEWRDDGLLAIDSESPPDAAVSDITEVSDVALGDNSADALDLPVDEILVCIPVAQTDLSCDGVDDDCDEQTDEDYVADTTCFLPGPCAVGNIPSSCLGGVESFCATGAPQPELCNGIDDDCDDEIDEDFTELGKACSGQAGDSCSAGIWACDVSGVPACIQDWNCNYEIMRCSPDVHCEMKDYGTGTPATGCCDANGSSQRFYSGGYTTQSCASGCGWIAAENRYGCGGSGVDPAGLLPRDCVDYCDPARACEEMRWECGSPCRSSSQSCGTCGNGLLCIDGRCGQSLRESEPNGDLATANEGSIPGMLAGAGSQSSADNEYWRLSPSRAGMISVEAFASWGGPDGQFTPDVRLLDASGIEIASLSGGRLDHFPIQAATHYLAVRMPAGGTLSPANYFITIRPMW